MPRGRPIKNIEETTPKEPTRQGRTPPIGPELEGSGLEQSATDSGVQETVPEEQASASQW